MPTAEIFPVNPADVATLLDGNVVPSGRTLTLATAAVPIITVMARAYTRGRGFTGTGQPACDEIAAVITTAAARLAANTAQVSASTTTDDRTRDLRSCFQGWSLAELAVLNRYRVTAM